MGVGRLCFLSERLNHSHLDDNQGGRRLQAGTVGARDAGPLVVVEGAYSAAGGRAIINFLNLECPSMCAVLGKHTDQLWVPRTRPRQAPGRYTRY